MTDELMIIGGLDQPLPVDTDLVLNHVEASIQEGIKQRNAFIPLNVCRQLIQITQLAGLGLAKAIYSIKKNWDKFGIEDSFEEVAYDYLGKHTHTVERYVKVWQMFDENIAPLEFQQRNIRDLIPIANALAQDYEITEDQWDRLLEAPDFSTVSKIVREDIKGADPRKNALQLFIDEYGDVEALRDGKVYPVGHLNVLTDEHVVERAIERITKNSGILRR